MFIRELLEIVNSYYMELSVILPHLSKPLIHTLKHTTFSDNTIVTMHTTYIHALIHTLKHTAFLTSPL